MQQKIISHFKSNITPSSSDSFNKHPALLNHFYLVYRHVIRFCAGKNIIKFGVNSADNLSAVGSYCHN